MNEHFTKKLIYKIKIFSINFNYCKINVLCIKTILKFFIKVKYILSIISNVILFFYLINSILLTFL